MGYLIFVIFLTIAIPILVLSTSIYVYYRFKRKDYKKIVLIFLIFVLLILAILQNDFIKSRKHIDEEWMIGKSETIVQLRYSGKFDGMINQDECIQIDGREYHFCVREIFEYDAWENDIEGELYYYVITDENNIITDVICYQWGGVAPYSEYRDFDRW